MGISTEGLRAFVAVADTGSFSRAGARLHLSQPAVSKRVDGLEQTLGVRVFDRLGKQPRLTPAGEALLERARALIADLDGIGHNMQGARRTLGGTLRFGASYHVGLHRLPPALERFHHHHPQVRLDLQFLDSESGCAAVERGALEFAAITLPDAARTLELVTVWTDPFAVVVHQGHELAGRPMVSPAALCRYPALLPAPGTITRRLILRALPATQRNIGITSNHLEVLKVLAGIGLGWSALPLTLIDDTLEVVHIEDISIVRQLGVVTRRGRTLSDAANKMIELIRETA
ncbi:MAG: LysR family transcriptional regulator [Acidiferrobacteraceae bacterium]